ncbi:MAG: Alcohol dehydrogenase, zinc-binding domain protein [Verrucomicrobiales bacterium]|nr:Alcohol dehydrogenase, zinc-binding domain protein [Verrucomicrobiales bacterium]
MCPRSLAEPLDLSQIQSAAFYFFWPLQTIAVALPIVRAAILYGKEDVRVEAVSERPLAPGEVRIRIEAALTCGTDLKVFRRGYHAKMIVPPAVFGHELAGVISEVHPSVASWRVGDRVVVANSAPCGVCFYCQHNQENLCDDLLFLNGAYAESIVVPRRLVQKNLYQLEPETRFEDAALTEPLACVVQGVEETKLVRGERVLIIGAGPIGLMFTRLAFHAGCLVSVVGRGEARLQTALSLGAVQAVPVGGDGNLMNAVKLSAGSAFDVVIEAVGKPETWQSAVRLVRKGGRVNFFGGCPSDTVVSFDTGLIHYSNLTLLASFHHTPKTIQKALGLIETGIIQGSTFINGTCRLTNLPDLFKAMAAGNSAVKTLIQAG